VAIDLGSKQVVFDDLGYPGPPSIPLQTGRHVRFEAPPGAEGVTQPYLDGWLTFRLYTSFNRGALWGIGQGWSVVFACLSVVAVGVVIYWLFYLGNASSLWITVALSLIMSGALGNLYDRLGAHGAVEADGARLHAVRDFLLFTFGTFAWPVFNFADVFLVTGAIMLGLYVLVTPDPAQVTPSAEATSPAQISASASGTEAAAPTTPAGSPESIAPKAGA